MVAEAVVAAAVVAEAEARGAAGAAAPEAVEEDRTEALLTGTELFRLQPAPILGRVFFCWIFCAMVLLATLEWRECLVE